MIDYYLIDYCMATYHHFYDLPVYKICRQFRKQIATIAQTLLPNKEAFMLRDQLLRASRSITANIAEGFGRYHYQENIQFCRQARGSLTETLEHMVTAFDEQYISKALLAATNKDYELCLKAINGYIKYLKEAKAGNNNQ
jgi:four helix bundle protein